MAITPEEFDLIRKFIHEHSGILVGDGKEYLIENRLTPLLVQNGCENFIDLDKKLKADTGPLRAKVIDAMTTNETLWFRDDSFYGALRDSIVPWLIERGKKQPKVRIWSAASSTGQEPYSVAILLTDALSKTPGAPPVSKFEIMATDISPSAIFIAKTARYSQLAIMRGMKPEYLEKYFTKMGLAFQLNEELKSLVEFRQFNLKESFSSLGTFDFIMCRNVLIYFADDLKSAIYGKHHQALAKDGYLAIGASESPRGYTTKFKQVLMGSAALFKPE